MKHFTVFFLGVFSAMSLVIKASYADTVFQVLNDTHYGVEFSGLIGGYPSVNPLTVKHPITTITKDPGAKFIRGHIMVYANDSKNYLDNIIFSYQSVNHHGQLSVYDLYHQLKLSVHANTLVIKDEPQVNKLEPLIYRSKY